MLSINPITNVKSTINNKMSFMSGVCTNYGAVAINNTADMKHEGSFLTDFLGAIKQSPLFYEAFFQRQAKIEKGLEAQENKLNAIA